MSTKTDNIVNPNSCWNKAANDEPIFVLRAHDGVAADLVVMWANKYALSKGGYARMNEAQQAKYREALQCAQEMRIWFQKILDDDIPF